MCHWLNFGSISKLFINQTCFYESISTLDYLKYSTINGEMRKEKKFICICHLWYYYFACFKILYVFCLYVIVIHRLLPHKVIVSAQVLFVFSASAWLFKDINNGEPFCINEFNQIIMYIIYWHCSYSGFQHMSFMILTYKACSCLMPVALQSVKFALINCY